ncbi:MAG: hypothetical protein M1822_009093 [Bathelium mastoideum]|nr:MAG: hypothetical protein M1822_009093 [Bathelium mastoideum]
MTDSVNIDELPPLSNQDVRILYSIIDAAQNSPDPPFRALFAAYDRVLAENGINPDHDPVYLRFLLRMGEGGVRNGDLLERFQVLLARMGIQIEIAPQGEAVEEVTRQFEDGDAPDEGYNQSPEENVVPTQAKKRTRRVSFNDSNLENTWRSRNSTDPPIQQSHTQSSLQLQAPQAATQGANHGQSKASRHPTPPRLLEQHPIRGRMKSHNIEGVPQLNQPVTRSQSFPSGPSFGGVQTEQHLQKHGRSASISSVEARGSQGSGYTSDASLDDKNLARRGKVPPQYIYRPSDTQILSDAEIFLAHSRSIFLRKLLRRWRDSAAALHKEHESLEERARRYDSGILLREGFNQWRNGLVEKRQEAETERFFGHLERRAGKARNLFLLTKAFTHWAQCASEEVARTSVARRHIVRTKYFNAWKDITVVNELKVRRQGLRKFMSIWRQRTAKALNDEDLATAWHEERLVNRVGWYWWHLLLERIAPELHLRFIKRRYFYKWRALAQERNRREAQAESTYCESLQRRGLLSWKSRIAKLQERTSATIQAYEKSLAMACLGTYRKQASLMPLAIQTSQAVDSRVARTALILWQNRSRNDQQAASVSRQRLLRNMWTLWNDHLRCNILKRTLDDHALMGAMLRWMLAERCALYWRLAKINQCRSFLVKWKAKAVDYSRRLETAYATTQQSRNKRLVTFALVKWHGESRRIQDMSQQALAHSRSYTQQQFLTAWREKVNKITMLSQMCESARFYVLAKSSISHWRSATSNMKRKRRREAYATVRRRTKLRLAQRLLHDWQGKAAEIREWQIQAEGQRHQAVLNTIRKNLQIWRSKTMRIEHAAHQAEEMRSDKVLALGLSTWKEKLQTMNEMKVTSEAYYADAVDTTATNALKKWGMKVFQLRRMDESSKALWVRNQERHRMGMLRYWAERAIARHNHLPEPLREDEAPNPNSGILNLFRSLHLGPSAPPSQSTPHAPQPFTSSIVDTTGYPLPPSATARAENWTAFDDDRAVNFATFIADTSSADQPGPNLVPAPERPQTTTPLPGYLRSPSKRRARFRSGLPLLTGISGGGGVASSAAASNTPAGTPRVVFRAPLTPVGREKGAAVALTGRGVTPFASKLRGVYEGGRIPRRVVEVEEEEVGGVREGMFEDIGGDGEKGAGGEE